MISADQLRASRGLLNWSQGALAEAAGTSAMTVKRAEGTGQPPATAEAVERLQHALEKAGVIFVAENGEGPGVRLKKGKRR